MTEPLFPAKKIYRVSELAEALNHKMESEFSELRVQGEISGFHQHKSGHLFFSLKDESSKLEVIMFRFQALYLKFRPEDGLEVIIRGRLNFYHPRGELRLIAEAIEPVGLGALQLAFEQLKQKLAAEGLFAKERKRPIPEFCRRIVVITSPTGAVFQDLLKIFWQRKTRLEILLIPSRVQGEGAEVELAEAIELSNRPEIAEPVDRLPLDLIVLARGGGSLEDLWSFNTERLARSIYKSRIPVMSAVGHEVDYTISDWVADERAPTPTAAAERIAQSQLDVIRRLDQAGNQLAVELFDRMEGSEELLEKFARSFSQFRFTLRQMDQGLVIYRHRLNGALVEKIRLMKEQWIQAGQKLQARSPAMWLRQNREKTAGLEAELEGRVQSRISQARESVSRLAGGIQALSPLSTLGRGYSILMKKSDQAVIADQKEVEVGDELELILDRGELGVRVGGKKEKNRWEEDETEPDKNSE